LNKRRTIAQMTNDFIKVMNLNQRIKSQEQLRAALEEKEFKAKPWAV
jgi:hypothetical protein